MDNLPNELLYLIMDFLSPFDTINFIKVYPLKSSTHFKNELDKEIFKFSNGNNKLSSFIQNIICSEDEIDLVVLHIIKELFYIFKKAHKYMDILGYAYYTVIIKKGNKNIKIENVFDKDSQIIYIYYSNLEKMSCYLESFLNITKNNNKYSYTIKNYNIKKLVTSIYSDL